MITNEQSLEFFHSALCNAEGTSYMESYGISLEYNEHDYNTAKENLKKENKSICTEDVLIQILKEGGNLVYKDNEGSEDDAIININDVYERVPKVPNDTLQEMINGNDDANTADIILQIVFYKEIIFG